MRKIFALAMVAILSLTVALAVIGCGGQKAEETTPAPTEQMSTPMESTGTMTMDSTAQDTAAAK
jgi:hypothetical protein